MPYATTLLAISSLIPGAKEIKYWHKDLSYSNTNMSLLLNGGFDEGMVSLFHIVQLPFQHV